MLLGEISATEEGQKKMCSKCSTDNSFPGNDKFTRVHPFNIHADGFFLLFFCFLVEGKRKRRLWNDNNNSTAHRMKYKLEKIPKNTEKRKKRISQQRKWSVRVWVCGSVLYMASYLSRHKTIRENKKCIYTDINIFCSIKQNEKQHHLRIYFLGSPRQSKKKSNFVLYFDSKNKQENGNEGKTAVSVYFSERKEMKFIENHRRNGTKMTFFYRFLWLLTRRPFTVHVCRCVCACVVFTFQSVSSFDDRLKYVKSTSPKGNVIFFLRFFILFHFFCHRKLHVMTGNGIYLTKYAMLGAPTLQNPYIEKRMKKHDAKSFHCFFFASFLPWETADP